MGIKSKRIKTDDENVMVGVLKISGGLGMTFEAILRAMELGTQANKAEDKETYSRMVSLAKMLYEMYFCGKVPETQLAFCQFIGALMEIFSTMNGMGPITELATNKDGTLDIDKLPYDQKTLNTWHNARLPMPELKNGETRLEASKWMLSLSIDNLKSFLKLANRSPLVKTRTVNRIEAVISDLDEIASTL